MPLPLLALGGAFKVAGGFIAQHWRTVAAVVLVGVVLGFCYVTGRKHERNVWKPKIEAIQAAHKAASEAAQAERAATETQHAAQRQAIVDHFQERIHANNAALDAALERVRVASRVRPLAPASAAPAPCRDYEAGPEQLPQPHREFLVREAARADAVVEQLGACQKYAVELHALCSAPAPN
jgi:hypothetical protein